MSASTAGIYSVPAKAHFSLFHPGDDLSKCVAALNAEWPSYEIVHVARRSNRTHTVLPAPRRLLMCSATIVVVPRNLVFDAFVQVYPVTNHCS